MMMSVIIWGLSFAFWSMYSGSSPHKIRFSPVSFSIIYEAHVVFGTPLTLPTCENVAKCVNLDLTWKWTRQKTTESETILAKLHADSMLILVMQPDVNTADVNYSLTKSLLTLSQQLRISCSGPRNRSH